MGPPARHLLLRHCNSYGAAGFANSHFAFHQQKAPSLIPPEMEEEGNSSSKIPGKELEQEAGLNPITPTTTAAVAASIEEQRSYQAGWLQLGVGSAPATSNTASTSPIARLRVSMELQLFPERPPILPAPAAPAVPASASTSYGAPAADRLVWRPESSDSAAGLPGGLRVVSQPQRARSSLWVALRPAENQVNAPFLPQLTKSYLRIKDGRMTVRLLMRYLANKFGLQDESEVEITCRREQLMPFATLEEVRDRIWCARNSEVPGPASPAIDHVMKLYYSRRA